PSYTTPMRNASVPEELPQYLEKSRAAEATPQAGIFNPKHVKQLVQDMRSKNQVSEIDNMAITAILSVQILNELFINRSIQELNDNELVNLDKTVIDY